MVIKRDGTEVTFDKQKIVSAIKKAFAEVGVDGDKTPEMIADTIETFYKTKDKLDVEEIQDLVEELLMDSEYKSVARAYVRYRYKKEVARNYKDDFLAEIGLKLRADAVENSNANLDEHSFGGRVGAASDVMLKKYALEYCMSEKSRYNHENNLIYIHDLNSYPVGMHNCLSVPLDDLLAKGFNTRQVDVRPAQSINTAMQLTAVIFQLQSLNQFGSKLAAC